MAIAPIEEVYDQGAVIMGWNLVSGETGTAIRITPWADITVFITGTFGAGAVGVEIAGDPVTPVYVAPKDLDAAVISAKVANYVGVIREHGVLIRAVATGITAVSVRLVCTAARMRI